MPAKQTKKSKGGSSKRGPSFGRDPYRNCPESKDKALVNAFLFSGPIEGEGMFVRVVVFSDGDACLYYDGHPALGYEEAKHRSFGYSPRSFGWSRPWSQLLSEVKAAAGEINVIIQVHREYEEFMEWLNQHEFSERFMRDLKKMEESRS